MSHPLVSILIPAYNAAPWIAETLRSALAQTWSEKEVIVIDDGSTDNTLELARSFEVRGVRVLTQPNRGASAARNYAFRESRGAYIQYLDADDLLAPDKIAMQMERMAVKSYPPDLLTSGRYAYFSDHPGDTEPENIPLYKDWPDPLDWIVTAWNQGYFITIHSWLTPRALIEKAGPWDESLSMNDDGEFFARVILASNGIYHCDNALAYYRKVDGSLSKAMSDKAMSSLLYSADKYEQLLLAKKNTAETRLTCANVYMRIMHTYYPDYQKQLRPLDSSIKRLGGSTLRLYGNWRVQFFEWLMGWKKTKQLTLFLLNRQINPRAILKGR